MGTYLTQQALAENLFYSGSVLGASSQVPLLWCFIDCHNWAGRGREGVGRSRKVNDIGETQAKQIKGSKSQYNHMDK